MTDWKKNWYSSYAIQWKKTYWYNEENISTWLNPNYFESEKDFFKMIKNEKERHEAQKQAQLQAQKQAQLQAQKQAQKQAAIELSRLNIRKIDFLFTFEKNEILECNICNIRLKAPVTTYILQCGKCKKYIRAVDKKTSREQINNINKMILEEQNKKRKLYNEELKSCRENSKNVIDKLTEENKKLKRKVSDLENLLNSEKNVNKRIKETELFKTWRFMDEMQTSNSDIFVRKDGRPSKNSILI